ncbi:MAG: uroporphyrinogen-III synthase [Burkholderiales bacterium]
MLGGRGILVTRPRAQAAGLLDLIRAEGGDPVLFPTIAITPVDDVARATALLARLADFDHVIFVSANAVTFGLALAPSGWPHGVDAIAVGPATAKALATASIPRVLMPGERFDSEGVLDMAVLRHPVGKRVMIVRGVGGRDVLACTLAERGALVEIAEVYARADPCGDSGALVERWRAGRIHAVICTASEAVRNLHGSLAGNADLLARTPMFVPHGRIALAARALHLTDVIETATGDQAIVRAIDAFFAKVEG